MRTTPLLLLLSLLSTSLPAWNGQGHIAIAEAAYSIVSPATQQWISITAKGESMESLSIWPDRVRGKMRWTASWHYISIPLSPTVEKDDIMSFCAGRKQCSLSALRKQIDVLRTTEREDIRRNALSWIIHLVGDIHQPLHNVNDNDRGGNQKFLHFRGRQMSLHELWDHTISKDGGSTTPVKKNALEETIALKLVVEPKLVSSTPLEWANESYSMAQNIYSDYNGPEGKNLGDTYSKKWHLSAVNRQAIAALRLAYLLDLLAANQLPLW